MTTARELRAAKRARLTTELARLRYDHGLTIREVADACQISTISLLSAWENGHSRPGREYLARLSAFYNVPADRLLAGMPRRAWVRMVTA